MNGLTIITMAIVCTIIWGGFIFFLTTAVRSEKKKNTDG